MQITLKESKELIKDVLTAGLVPYIKGSPGLGKSALIRAIAEEANLKVIDIRLSTAESVDMTGYPDLSGDRATYKAFDTFPLEGDVIPAGYSGWIIFYDELPQAMPSVQKACMKILLDRMVNQTKLHPMCFQVCAGNLTTDNAGATNLLTALMSRLVHFQIKSDLEGWLEYADSKQFDHRLLSYIRYAPQQLNNFNPQKSDDTFACERTWEFLNNLLKVWNGSIDADKLAAIKGVIGEGAGGDFYVFSQVYAELPTFTEIAKDPEGAIIPNLPDRMFAVSGMVSGNVDVATFPTVIKYIKRLPSEFQVLTMKSAVKRNMALMTSPEFMQWSIELGNDIYG